MIEKFRKEIDLVEQGEIARPLHADALLKVYVAAIRNGAAPAAGGTAGDEGTPIAAPGTPGDEDTPIAAPGTGWDEGTPTAPRECVRHHWRAVSESPARTSTTTSTSSITGQWPTFSSTARSN